MKTVDAVMQDTKAILQDMKRMSSESKGIALDGVEKSNKNQFAEVLKHAMAHVEKLQQTTETLKTVNDSPKVALNMNHLTTETRNANVAMQILEDAIQAYRDIENMQL